MCGQADQQREISDNANDALTKHVGRNGFPGESFADYKTGFFDGYDIASTKPVMSEPISLERCVQAAIKAHWNDGMLSDIELVTKAVLDAAGVKYVG